MKSLIVDPVRTGHTPRERNIHEDDERIYFVKTDTLREGVINFKNSDFLPAHKISIRDFLKSNNVIVTIIGANFNIIGRAAIFMDNFQRTVVNQNIAIIKPNEKLLNPFYLMVFLNSKYGREQLWMLSRQTEQVNLNCREIEELSIPQFNLGLQRRIETLVRDSSRSIEESNLLYTQAEDLLLEELGLKDFKHSYELSYTSNLSSAFEVHRVDAEYFQPIYNELIKNFGHHEVKKLGELAYRKKMKTYADAEENYKYIEISDINTDIGEVNYTERLGKQLPPNARIPIDGGELIISKVRPTRGAIGIVAEELSKNIFCSSAFSVFTVSSPLKEYLYLIARSIIGKLQMERPTTGTSYPTINDRDVENINVPTLPDETQQKLASFVRQSYEARSKAKQLLEEAKRIVENAIETESN